MTSTADLPRDLDGWPYRTDTPLGPWRVTPCCGAFAEFANDGSLGMKCKACHGGLPENFVDAAPRLDPAEPTPAKVAYVIGTTPADHEAQPMRGTVVDQRGRPCWRARHRSYPLRAICAACNGPITCADGAAAWAHNTIKAKELAVTSH